MVNSIAQLSQDLPRTWDAFRILPAGVFRASDGRPANLPGWKIDAGIAARVIAASATANDIVIDYEHQTLKAQTNGKEAPAAGWFKRLLWREGQGLFAVGVQWTARAKAMIAANEYRYISPVFCFSEVTGEVLKIVGIGLTNNPALSGLTDLAALSARPGGHARLRESDRSVEAFNSAFGPAGMFHPDTPPETLAALTGRVSKPELPAHLVESDPRAAEVLRHVFPEVWGQ